MSGTRIGIFGGTFNPVHVAHVRAAIEVAEALGLSAVEFIPSARPPHKIGGKLLDFELRAALCRAAVAGIPGFSVNLLEADRPGPSYTRDTLAELAASRPGQDFCFILGLSDLLCLPSWKDGLGLGRLADLAVHSREGQGIEAFTAFLTTHAQGMGATPTADPAVWTLPGGHAARFVPITRLDVSASDIRARWRSGRRIDGLVCQAVLSQLLTNAETLRTAWGRAVSA
ncbi:nicotinate (nicotinamide) nucleotide adenylyltransferase [Solidesulfovibrio magneticus]|uniref:Probable nicotinate-nucleotide adenylyltransferase n=1 Tax=Solidesulfovibrio magneticus (strain ATCC 700980 / DSM 13731 / RS-1) TaxID=573370 RepID=C4XSQ3_SOLM1|nr:nicotinate (nicotinamide) nucleotide adenylyltransferase [Solidesulfovibrio magneticus]BAH75745.1 probable nicotinate-nucleotide adenylyltransferase [Solidesulfovibrio magneticus RS-1]